MSKPELSWLMLGLLGSLMLPGSLRAQAADSTLTLELLQRIEQLELEVRSMRGQLELYRYQVEELQRERAAASATTRVESPETAPAPSAPAPPVAPNIHGASPATAPSAAVAGADQADFDAALARFRDGQYPEAIAGFQHFLKAYPDNGLAGDAQYWLGESWYVSRNEEAARDAFINLGLRYPQSTRLPDALLKLGYLYAQSGDTGRAREVLQKLVQVYPDSEAARLAQQRLSSLR